MVPHQESLCPVRSVQQDVCAGAIGRVEGDRVNGGSLLRHGKGHGSWWMTGRSRTESTGFYQNLSLSSCSFASSGLDPMKQARLCMH